MKKIGIVFLILGCFISNVKAASLCSYEEQVELSKSAINVKMSFEEAEGVKEPGTYSVPEMEDPETYEAKYDYFKLKLVNITDDIYVKLENSTNNDIKYIVYNDTDEGTFEINWEDLTKVTTFRYTIFTSEESKCPNEELRTGVLTVPMYNRYHNSLACQDADKSNVCRKFVYSDIDYDVFETSIKTYKDKHKKNENKEEQKDNKTLNFIENNKVTIIIISTIIVAGVITGVIVIKKTKEECFMKKTNKNLRLYLFLLSLCIVPINKVWAGTYTYNQTSVDSDRKVVYTNGNGIGTTFYGKLSGGGVTYDDIYCIDPGTGDPVNGAQYNEVSLGEQEAAAYKYICDNSNNHDVKSFAFRVVGIEKNTLASGDVETVNAYKDWYERNGETPTFAGSSTLDTELRNLIGGALSESSYDVETPELVSMAQSDDKVSYNLDTKGYEGNLIINAPSSDITVDGHNYTDSYNGTINSDNVSIIIELNSCTTDENYHITFEYDGSAGGATSHTVKKFQSTQAGQQYLVACIPDGDMCVGSGCKAEASGTLTCNNMNCDPEINNDMMANNICDLDGNTMVTVDEFGPSVTDPMACLDDGKDVIGSVINATASLIPGLSSDNNYCKILCYETFQMDMPGPDASDGIDEVFINSGSYFTIDSSGFKSKNEVICKQVTDYNALEAAVNAERQKIKDKFNKYQLGLAVNGATFTDDVKENKDADGNVISTQDICVVSNTPSYKQVSYSGGQFTVSNGASLNGTYNKTCAAKKSEYTTISASEFNSAYSTINSNIAAEIAKWNECTQSWDFDSLNSCPAEVDFDYYEGYPIDITSSSDRTPSITGVITGAHSLKDGVCDASGNGCNSTISLSDGKRDGTLTIDTQYEFKNGFVVNFETGEIDWDTSKAGGEYSEVIEGFPVSLETPQGRYYYQYNYYGFGHYFDTNTCGRLEAIMRDYGYNDDDDYSLNCMYDVNNCDDCTVICPDSSCNFSFVCDDECKVACVGGGCIMNANEGFLATYRTISLNELRVAHNTRLISNEPAMLLAMASTKEYDSKTNNTNSNWGTAKGQNAKLKVETAGETIYEKAPEYSIKLTPGVISEIRQYNKKAETEGAKKGYLNDTLTCKSISGKDYGLCISSFVREEVNFEINKPVNSVTGQIAGKNIYYEIYPNYSETNKAFQGPAWK